MKSILRKIFSPKFIIFLILILEIAIVGALWYLFQTGIENIILSSNPDSTEADRQATYIMVIILRTAFYIIDFLILYRIINREENPEYKIPWLVIMIFSPMVAGVLYLLFGRNVLTIKEELLVKEQKKVINALSSSDVDKEEFESLDEYKGVYNYLKDVTKLRLSKNNHLTYFKNGEEFFPDLVESLKKAKEFILIEFFIIGTGIWWDRVFEVLKAKASEGVKVKLIYDDIGSFGTVPENFLDILKKAGIDAYKFHPFRPTLNIALNNRTHRKIVVIDHMISYTGGMNLADEYANEIVRFGYWKDTMLKIEGPGIYNLIQIFLEDFDLAKKKISDYMEFLDGNYPIFEDEGYCFAFGDGPGPYDGFHNVGEDNYINLINSAKKEIYISTPYLITPYSLQKAIVLAARRGIKVNLIVPAIPDKKLVYWLAKGEFHHFLKAGVKIYTYTKGFNHEKQMLVDSNICFIGTINFDFRSLTHHFECGATISGAKVIDEIEEDFKNMVSESNLVPADFKMNAFQRFIIGIVKVFRTLL